MRLIFQENSSPCLRGHHWGIILVQLAGKVAGLTAGQLAGASRDCAEFQRQKGWNKD
jgi:hypothetical protein